MVYPGSPPDRPQTYAEALADAERAIILAAYERSGRNKARTARALDMDVRTLRRKLAALEIGGPQR